LIEGDVAKVEGAPHLWRIVDKVYELVIEAGRLPPGHSDGACLYRKFTVPLSRSEPTIATRTCARAATIFEKQLQHHSEPICMLDEDRFPFVFFPTTLADVSML
jgi:hypothetical protein